MTAPVAGPFYLAWVDPGTAFDPAVHNRMDEYVFSIKRKLGEGEKPLVEMEIENPHVGLLSAPRKTWAWISWFNGTTIVALFYGELVANPVQIFQEVITVQLVTYPLDYRSQLQHLVEPMKVLPWYDPVLVEVNKRDDPDTVLEAWGKQWNIDHITGEVTAVGTLEGPDGNVTITADDHFYLGMNSTVTTPPATSIKTDVSVSWTQAAHGIVDLGSHTVTSYGDGVLGEVLKPLSSIGDGWYVFASDAVDANGTRNSTTVEYKTSFTNKEKTHEDGDTMSLNSSQVVPVGPVGQTKVLTQVQQVGFVDPFAVDADGDPSPTNIPASFNQTSASVMVYTINTSLVLEYRIERPRTERVVFTIGADLQAIQTRPLITDVSEIITLKGADVSLPIIDLLNWTAVAGLTVLQGQVVFPDNPQVPGTQSIQIAISVTGVAGTVPPNFSDVAGDETIDGTVTWASLGQAAPPENAQEWAANTHAVSGQIILPKRPFFVQYWQLTLPASRIWPPLPISVSEGQIVQASNGSFQVCTISGLSSLTEPAFSATWGVTVTSITAVWRSLGTTQPSGTAFQLCTVGGVTGALYMRPPFSETLHGATADGAATWVCIGLGEIPIGGSPGNTPSPSYFTTDRGQQTLISAALRTRARLLYRARCVQVSFDLSYLAGVDITTRKTVTLEDPRLAGGMATGKVIAAELVASDREFVTHVTIACTVGKDNAVEAVDGEPDYIDDDYIDSDYQVHEGAFALLPSGSDLSYAPPVYVPSDDGLTFPLTYDQVVVANYIAGSFGAQSLAVTSALDSMRVAANTLVGGSRTSQILAQRKISLLNSNSVDSAIQRNPVWIEYQVKPIAGQFNAVYVVKFSDLTVARGIDQESAVTT